MLKISIVFLGLLMMGSLGIQASAQEKKCKAGQIYDAATKKCVSPRPTPRGS